MSLTLADMAVEGLRTADGRAKTALSRRHAAAWHAPGVIRRGAYATKKATMTDQIQIWKRTDPGAPASIQPPYGATALRIVEARDGMDPSPDIFAADDDGKALLAYLLLYLENGVSTIAPRDHATLGVSALPRV